jgi:predicted neutral ceramidase superfamily lipid hydrolase
MRTMIADHFRARLASARRSLHRRSLVLIVAAERRLGLIAVIWTGLVGIALAGRLAATVHVHGAAMYWFASLALYALIALAPLAGIILAARAFPRGALIALPEIALARIGRWRQLDPLTAHAHPSFGASGLMAGFAIGLLINIAVRTSEFLMAVPAIAAVSNGWSHMLFLTLAIDCILFNLLYAAAFIMAVRHAPWFPRVMLLIWLADIMSQLLIAQLLGTTPLPGSVAAALTGLLTANVQKTLISIALWLPYLLLSERVNVTYRRRVRAQTL